MGNRTKTKQVSKCQPKNNIDLAIQVSDRIDIESVRLMKSMCEQKRIVGVGQKNFDIKYDTETSIDGTTSRIFVLANFVLQTNEIEPNGCDPFATIKATFLLIYRTDTIDEITGEALKFFGEANGIYNAWPYWREFVQNTIVRMGLPPLTIPVFRIFAPKKSGEAQEKIVEPKKKKVTGKGSIPK